LEVEDGSAAVAGIALAGCVCTDVSGSLDVTGFGAQAAMPMVINKNRVEIFFMRSPCCHGRNTDK
jgi:hypothetical protein